MGQSFSFDCPRCGYSETVAAGESTGMLVTVRTNTCADCRRLVDVIIDYFGRHPGGENPEFEPLLDRCPECRGTNLKPWPKKKRPCPQCGERMERGEEMVCWD